MAATAWNLKKKDETTPYNPLIVPVDDSVKTSAKVR
jgi:hypothetical protein